MIKYVLILLSCCLNLTLLAQTAVDSVSQKKDTSIVYGEITKMAEFPGGQTRLYAYISNNVKYPKEAQKNGIEGKVIVQFIINNDGTIANVQTMGTKVGWGLEEEAIRIIKTMPNWEPAEMKGKKIAMQFRIPINFEIADDQIKPKPKLNKKVKSRSKAFD